MMETWIMFIIIAGIKYNKGDPFCRQLWLIIFQSASLESLAILTERFGTPIIGGFIGEIISDCLFSKSQLLGT